MSLTGHWWWKGVNSYSVWQPFGCRCCNTGLGTLVISGQLSSRTEIMKLGRLFRSWRTCSGRPRRTSWLTVPKMWLCFISMWLQDTGWVLCHYMNMYTYITWLSYQPRLPNVLLPSCFSVCIHALNRTLWIVCWRRSSLCKSLFSFAWIKIQMVTDSSFFFFFFSPEALITDFLCLLLGWLTLKLLTS